MYPTTHQTHPINAENQSTYTPGLPMLSFYGGQGVLADNGEEQDFQFPSGPLSPFSYQIGQTRQSHLGIPS